MNEKRKHKKMLIPSSGRPSTILPGERAAIHKKIDEVLRGGERLEITLLVQLLLELRPISRRQVSRSKTYIPR
jgi:hypothetical protein